VPIPLSFSFPIPPASCKILDIVYTYPRSDQNLNVEENMSSSFVRKTNVIVRNLFGFVAKLQEESHSQRIYVSFCLFRFAFIPRYIDMLDEVK
jgi:hypothetical protein